MTRGCDPSETGAALAEVIAQVLQTECKLRALGRRSGFMSTRDGVWGLLRSLKLGGLQTVPALARAQPVARQRIQKLADNLEARGLVAFERNPAHRRSHFVVLTPTGERLYDYLSKRLARMSSTLAADMEARGLAVTVDTLGKLAGKLDALLGDTDDASIALGTRRSQRKRLVPERGSKNAADEKMARVRRVSSRRRGARASEAAQTQRRTRAR